MLAQLYDLNYQDATQYKITVPLQDYLQSVPDAFKLDCPSRASNLVFTASYNKTGNITSQCVVFSSTVFNASRAVQTVVDIETG